MTLWAAAVIAGSTLDHWIVFRCFPCFVGGVIAYQGLEGRSKRPLPPQLWPVALLAVSAFYQLWGRTGEAYQDLGGYVSCLFLGMLIPLFRELPESWLTRAGHTVAKYSYGIYLVHIPAIWFAFVKLASAPAWLRWAVLATLSAGLPVVLYHLLEEPLINLGRSLAEALRRHGDLSRSLTGCVESPERPLTHVRGS